MGRVGWGAKGRIYHILEQKSSHCVFTEVYKQPQFTCQAETVADSCFTPSVALLMHPKGILHSIVDNHE